MPRRLSLLLLALAPVGLAAITVPHVFSNGTVADAAQMNANFTALTDAVTGLENGTTSARVLNAAADPFACVAGKAGVVYLNTTSNEFFACNGSAWRSLKTRPLGSATNPATSCKEILDAGDSVGSAFYTLRVDGQVFQAFCDMETDGGGWTVVWSGNAGDAGSRPYDETEYGTTTDPRSGKYKLAWAKWKRLGHTQHVFVRRPTTLNRWLVVQAPFFSATHYPFFAGHNHAAVYFRSSTGESASGVLGTSNVSNANGGWYAVATSIDHHSATYIELNSSCGGDYVYTYTGNFFAANTALGAGWPVTASCSSAAADNPATMVGLR